nr:DUF2889 domain-containing protein [uncultured Albidiferax sp.]
MFRRRIILHSETKGEECHVRAALEDDFHHFRVEVVAVDGRVTRILAESPRRPYSLCSNAIAELDVLLGMELSPVAHAVTRLTDPTQQCTHLFELAGLAIAAAARSIARRQYDVEVPTRIEGRALPTLARDGVPLLAWEVQGTVIQSPAAYAGIDLNRGMARWALSTLPQDEAEAALVLRRCTGISKGRGMNLDHQAHAQPNGHCFSQQPQRASQAIRMVGSTWDFSQTAERLCADDQTWLEFK